MREDFEEPASVYGPTPRGGIRLPSVPLYRPRMARPRNVLWGFTLLEIGIPCDCLMSAASCRTMSPATSPWFRLSLEWQRPCRSPWMLLSTAMWDWLWPPSDWKSSRDNSNPSISRIILNKEPYKLSYSFGQVFLPSVVLASFQVYVAMYISMIHYDVLYIVRY